MTTLVVEDDHTSRLVLEKRLASYGAVEFALNGVEAVEAVERRLRAGVCYDLICLDIMLPEMDGQQALKRIRSAEDTAGFPVGKGAKIVMTTALGDADNIMKSFRDEADGYLIKPIEGDKLDAQLKTFGLAKPAGG